LDFEVRSCHGHIRDLRRMIWASMCRIIISRAIVPAEKEKGEGIERPCKEADEVCLQRMRTVKEKPSAGTCAKCWA
jgi:hypothetical protein